MAGSFGYAAPEVMEKRGHSKPVDMWSLGVITYTLLCGYSPFRSETMGDLIEECRNEKVIFHPRYWTDVSDDAKDFIKALLKADPRKRPTSEVTMDGSPCEKKILTIFSKHSSTAGSLAKLHLIRTCCQKSGHTPLGHAFDAVLNWSSSPIALNHSRCRKIWKKMRLEWGTCPQTPWRLLGISSTTKCSQRVSLFLKSRPPAISKRKASAGWQKGQSSVKSSWLRCVKRKRRQPRRNSKRRPGSNTSMSNLKARFLVFEQPSRRMSRVCEK